MRNDWLDERLQAIAALIPEGAAWVADIGADHGRLACALLTVRPELRMVVADISADSLAKARRLLAARGLEERVRFAVADGLKALAGQPVQAIVLAGMGAETLQGILAAPGADEAVGAARVILQANVDVPMLRRWLTEHGYALEAEAVAAAAGRYYVILCARRGTAAPLDDKACALGPCLLAERPPEFMPYLRWRKKVLTRVAQRLQTTADLTKPDLAARLAACLREIAWIEEELL